MDASQVTVSRETMKEQELSSQSRYEIKKRIVKDIIKSTPYGKDISYQTFANALQVSNGNAWYFIERLIKKGHVAKHSNNGSYSYTWNEEPRIVKPAILSAAQSKSMGSWQRQRVFRKEELKQLIKNAKNGKITMVKLAKEVKVSTPTVKNLLKEMVDEGIIIDEKISERMHRYTVIEDSGVDASETVEQKPEVVESKSEERVQRPSRGLETNTNDIVERAKKFAWDHNSDSLRDFIASLQ